MTKKRSFVDNAADPKQVKNAQKKEKKKELEESEDLRFVMKDQRGRRVIWRILSECGAYHSVFSTNSLVTHYNSGKQDLGHWLMAEATSVDENLYFSMFKENSELGRKHQ